VGPWRALAGQLGRAAAWRRGRWLSRHQHPAPAPALGIPRLCRRPRSTLRTLDPRHGHAHGDARCSHLRPARPPARPRPRRCADALKALLAELGFSTLHEGMMPLVIREHGRKYQLILAHHLVARKG
jgi:hypothetical protein